MYQIIAKNKLAALHIMVIILGFTGILGKLITLKAAYLVWYRMLIAFVALFFFMFFKNNIKKIQKKNIMPLLGIGAIVALHWLFFFEAIKVSNISIAVICLATSSLFSSFLEPIFFKRKVLAYEVIFGILVLCTLYFMLNEPSTEKENINYVYGYIYGIISALLATLFTLLNAKYISKIDAVEITMLEMLGGVLTISLLFIINNDYSIIHQNINLYDITYLTLLATICTAGVFVWMIEIMRYITPYSLIMAVNLEPIYSVIIALIIFNESETMNLSFYIGGGIILAIVFLDGYIKNKQ